MIAEVVRFDLPANTTREAARSLYDRSARGWLNNPNLVEKYYLFDAQRCEGGGIYIWRSRAAMHRWHGEEYRRMVASRYGSVPHIQTFEALLHIDPVHAKMTGIDATE